MIDRTLVRRRGCWDSPAGLSSPSPAQTSDGDRSPTALASRDAVVEGIIEVARAVKSEVPVSERRVYALPFERTRVTQEAVQRLVAIQGDARDRPSLFQKGALHWQEVRRRHSDVANIRTSSSTTIAIDRSQAVKLANFLRRAAGHVIERVARELLRRGPERPGDTLPVRAGNEVLNAALIPWSRLHPRCRRVCFRPALAV